MIIELTRESTGQSVTINFDKVNYMEPALQNYFNPLRDDYDAKWTTDIHFDYHTIRVAEKHDEIWKEIERLSDLGKIVRVSTS